MRDTIKVSTVKDAHLLPPEIAGDDKIGYIRLEQFGENSSEEMERALVKLEGQGMQALVFDLRNNPGGLLDAAVEIAGKFLPPNQLVDPFAKPFRQTDVGRFHVERRPSHGSVVTADQAGSIVGELSGAGY